MKSRIVTILAVTMAAAAWTVSGAIVDVLPGNPNWANPLGENTGGGSSAITGTAPRSGNGSVEMFGDRTRFVGLGNFYSAASNLGLLRDVTGLTFDWMVAVGSVGTGPGAAASYSPALRLHIWDGTQRSELIWENAYNGNAAAVQGTWYTTSATDNFWRYQNAPINADSLIYNRSIADWSSLGYSANAYVSGISVGVGSTAGAGYHAFADNITLSFGENSTTYNFEVVAPVPEPSTYIAGALLLLPFAVSTVRRFRRSHQA
jgi:hypothetical protein